MGVGIDEDAVVAIDDAALAARITRQPGVAGRIDVARDDLIAGLELRRHVVVHAGGPHGAEPARHVVRPEHTQVPGRRRRRAQGPHFLRRDETLLHQQLLEAVEPVLVVRRGQVFGAGHQLARIAAHVDVPLAQEAGGHGERERLALPVVVEHGLVRLGLDRAQAVHAAHVVDAVHRDAFRPGALILPTPIIASRVTSEASSSSLMPSVPAGRSGSTM